MLKIQSIVRIRCSTNERQQDINRQVRELKQQGATDKTIYLEYESGMENAKAKGKTIGRPPVTADGIPNIFYRHYPKYQKEKINKKEFSRLCDLSYPTIYKYLHIVESQK